LAALAPHLPEALLCELVGTAAEFLEFIGGGRGNQRRKILETEFIFREQVAKNVRPKVTRARNEIGQRDIRKN
jgi:hypothetical protein